MTLAEVVPGNHRRVRPAQRYGVWIRSPGLLPRHENERTTFVIDTDRTVLDVIASEFSMDTHADKALEVLLQRQSA